MSISLLFADLNSGLVAKYLFTGNANDESGTGNNGTVYNAQPISDRDGNLNSAYGFGSNRYVLVPSNSTLNITNQITMVAWVYLHSGSSDWQSIYCKGGTSSMSSPYALLVKNYKIAFLPNRSEHYSSISVPTEEWAHVAVTWDGSTIKYYVNGVKDAIEGSYSTSLNVYNNDLLIGKDAPGATEWFNGNLDDLYLYNRALSESEIQELYIGGGAPQNIQITVNSDNVDITWDAIDGATYNLYSSPNPNLPISQWSVEASGLTGTSWSYVNSGDKMFYRVTAVF